MSELDDLLRQVQRMGVPGHVHDDGAAEESCPTDQICLSEEEPFSTLVKAPNRGGEVHVDTMTAVGVLSNLPDNAGLDSMWTELVEIDRGA
jgi:hypothetical protein